MNDRIRNSGLPEALPILHEEFLSAGDLRLAYYADRGGEGRPLVLIHSINAAASSFEVRPLFEASQGKRPVYSLDLPGFGHSERGPLDYSPDLFAGAIASFLRQVVGAPADVVALSLGCEFAARAALLAPETVASLVLVSPTGFGVKPLPTQGKVGLTARLLNLPGLSQWLFNIVASRRSIRYFLGLCFVGKPPESMLDYAYATAHQPGARHAPLAFLGMRLFTPSPTENLYARLGELPVLVMADKDPFVDFERLEPFVARHASWSTSRVGPHKGLPQWECREETLAVLDQFWSAQASGRTR